MIAFAAYSEHSIDIYVIKADGSCRTRLTARPGNEKDPVWSADGSRIAFVYLDDIHVMNALSTAVKRPYRNLQVFVLDSP